MGAGGRGIVVSRDSFIGGILPDRYYIQGTETEREKEEQSCEAMNV